MIMNGPLKVGADELVDEDGDGISAEDEPAMHVDTAIAIPDLPLREPTV